MLSISKKQVDSPVIRRHLVIYGSVQGVGLRYRACYAARQYGVTGWIQNDWEGSVTMELQGTEDQIDQVILAIERGTFVRIENMECKSLTAVDGESGFRVK